MTVACRRKSRLKEINENGYRLKYLNTSSLKCLSERNRRFSQAQATAALKKLKTIRRDKNIYFIPSSEFNAYLKHIKVILSAVKKYRNFSLVTSTLYTVYFFTAAHRGCVDNLGLYLFQKRSGMSDITLRMYAHQIKQRTSHFDVTFDLT